MSEKKKIRVGLADDEMHIRMLVANSASILEIEKSAIKAGFRTMRYDGMKKVLRGLTSVSEIERVVVAKSI